MAERDYFDIPDDDTTAPPEPAAPVLLPHTPDEDFQPIPPKKHSTIGLNLVAILIFLALLGGCAYMILHQIQNDHKPHKSAPVPAASP